MVTAALVPSSQATTTANLLQLLRPLKVLAQNWDIDVAGELDEFVGEVDRLSQNQLGGTGDVDFIQAALIIHNSANIYSRKVQHLYNLAQETHDYLYHDSVIKSLHQGTLQEEHHSKLFDMDAILRLGTYNQKKKFDTVASESVAMFWKPSFELETFKSKYGEIVGDMADFDITSNQIFPSGRIQTEVAEYLLDQLGRTYKVEFPREDEENEDQQIIEQDEAIVNDIASEKMQLDTMSVSGIDHEPFDDMQNNDYVSTFPEHETQPENTSQITEKRIKGIENIKDDHDAFWQTISPYEETRLSLIQPFAKGKPRRMNAKSTNATKQFANLSSIQDFVNNQVRKKMKDKLEVLKLNMYNSIVKSLKTLESYPNTVNTEELMENEDLLENQCDEIQPDWSEGDDHNNIELDYTQNANADMSERFHIETYYEELKDFEDCIHTEMMKRVKIWEDRLEKVLDDEFHRRQFDIQDYLTDITNCKESTITIPTISKTEEKYENCRYFVTALHMVNNKQLELSVEPNTQTLTLQKLM